MNEAVTFGRGLVGVLSSPNSVTGSDTVGAILVNPGIVSRIGPHRINVQLSRALALRGVPSLRMDLSGVGDSLASSEARSSKEIWTDDVISALEYLEEAHGLSRCVVIGKCTGARIAAEAALQTPRVAGIVPINFGAPPAMTEIPRSRRWRNWRWWRLFALNNIATNLRTGPKLLTTDESSLPPSEDVDFFGSDPAEIISVWRKALTAGIPVLAVYSEFDGHYDFFLQHIRPVIKREHLADSLELEVIKYADHTMTLPRTQEDFCDVVVKWFCRHFPATVG